MLRRRPPQGQGHATKCGLGGAGEAQGGAGSEWAGRMGPRCSRPCPTTSHTGASAIPRVARSKRAASAKGKRTAPVKGKRAAATNGKRTAPAKGKRAAAKSAKRSAPASGKRAVTRKRPS